MKVNSCLFNRRVLLPQISLLILLFCSKPTNGFGIDGVRTYTGLAISKIEFEGYTYPSEFNNLISATSGIELSFFEEPFGNFNTRLSYMERGGNEVSYNSDTTSKISFNYLSLGVIYKYRYKMGFANPTVSFGPRFDYLIRSWYEYERPPYEDYNCGFDLGVGLDKAISDNVVLSLDFTWDYQFIPVFEDFDKKQSVKNAFLCTIGFEYKFNNKAEL